MRIGTVSMRRDRVFLCGTRAVVRIGLQNYRVVCATCGNGGSVRHAIPEDADRAAVRDSNRSCRACGAN